MYFRRENHREILENCESLYGLFLLVRAVCVVRGSWNSKGVSIVILTAKGAKTANKKGSVPCSPETVPGRERGKENGVSPVVFGLTKRKCPL